MSLLYSLSVQSADGIQWNPGPLHGQKPNLYAKIYLDGKQIGRTRTVKRTTVPQWDDQVTISSEMTTAVISLKLFHDTSVAIRKDPCIGVFDIQLGDLSKLCDAEKNSKATNLQLVAAEGPSQGKPSAMLSVYMKNITPVQAKSAIDAAKSDIETRALGGAAAGGANFSDGLKAIITKLDIVIKIGDGISEINPYAKAAWKILTVVYETVKKQQYMDDKVLELVQAMIEVYSFVEDTEFLSDKVRRLENVVTAIVKQSWECAIFIREYTGYGFGGRLIRNTWSDTDQKIDGLSAALLKLKDAFDRGLAFQTVFFSVAIRAETEYLVQSDKLKSLNPLELDASQRTMCLPGTRQDVLAAITDWLTAPVDGVNILWLHGVAGAGKSTISTTISQYCRNLRRLGAFLFFDRNNLAGSSPGGVIRTIAYWMTMSNTHIRAAVSDAITSDAALATAPIQTQFQRLLLEPLNAAGEHILGPITVILDALDECGNAESRESLVSLIVDEFPKLPAVFRFFITSRPESDIAVRFRGCSHIAEMQLNITTDATRHDIVAYIQERMGNIRQFKRSLEPEWPGQHIVETLAEYSGGLFIWASTACKFIRSFDPKERLAAILTAGVANNLDELYTIALRNSADWTNAGFARDAHSVLGAIVLSHVPLTDHTIDKLLCFTDGRTAEVLEYLGCIVQWSPGQPARILHTSFSDYIADPTRSGGNSWFVDSKIQSISLALGCLRILNLQLHFNICDLKDSHILNSDIPELPARIEQHISAELKYASLFWSDHLQHPTVDNEILSRLKDLTHRQFLHWLEVLSLLGQVPIAIASLQIACDHVQQIDEAFQSLLQDAIKFLRGFSPLISQSAPHIYVSALPLAPRESLVRKLFAPSFPRTLKFTGPLGDTWSSLLKVFHGHTNNIHSVAFSPDGKQIASGSEDRTVRIWDSETGDVIVCNGHNDEVTAVVFSPDGRQIASGGRDGLQFWDSKTGALISAIAVDCWIHSVAFSPDGRQLAAGTTDNNVELWDLTTGTLAGEFQGHTGWIQSVAFSPDGKWIASGSWDHTVRFWDTDSRTLLTGPFEGHTDHIESVAFSPNGKLIVSGSKDNTLRVWDSGTGGIVAGPWEGGGWITSVAFSPNGKQIFAGSLNAVRILDSQTGSVVAGPFEHLGLGWTVAFSPDGKRIVSGSHDHNLCVWDAEINNLDAEQFPSHKSTSPSGSNITSISVSPDGQHLASASTDGIVKVFNCKTGVLVAGPLKHTNSVNSISFSPSGKKIGFACSGGELQVWNYQTGGVSVTLFTPLQDNPCTPSSTSDSSSELNTLSVAFSPDGHNIVAGFSDGTIKILSCETGDLVADLSKGHHNHVWGVSFSPDGKQIASCSEDHTIRIWNAENGATVVGPILGHTEGVLAIAFSPDGKYLASGSFDHTVRIWDSETGLAVSKLDEHTDAVLSVAFSPDGKYLASGSWDHTVQIWDFETGLAVSKLDEHSDTVLSVAFSPDGAQIVSGSGDTTVQVGDLKMAWEVVRTFDGHTDKVHSIAFLPNGKQIVSASSDSTLRAWEIEPLDDWGSHPRYTDGWLINSSSERILWVPPWLREELYLPWNSLVIGSRGTTKLDFSQFVHGTDWAKCREPISQRVHDVLQTAYLAD